MILNYPMESKLSVRTSALLSVSNYWNHLPSTED